MWLGRKNEPKAAFRDSRLSGNGRIHHACPCEAPQFQPGESSRRKTSSNSIELQDYRLSVNNIVQFQRCNKKQHRTNEIERENSGPIANTMESSTTKRKNTNDNRIIKHTPFDISCDWNLRFRMTAAVVAIEKDTKCKCARNVWLYGVKFHL